jgi:hypothetical protein
MVTTTSKKAPLHIRQLFFSFTLLFFHKSEYEDKKLPVQMENVIATHIHKLIKRRKEFLFLYNDHLSTSNSLARTQDPSSLRYHILHNITGLMVQTNEQIMSNKCLTLFAIGNLKRPERNLLDSL